ALRAGEAVSDELRASMRRMARLCALGAAPAFAVVVAIGTPLLSVLMRRDVSVSFVPLAILCGGQLLGGLAISSWLLSMTRPGSHVGGVAGVTLAIKTVLLFALIPIFGLVGAALATTTGTIVAQQGQTLAAARSFRGLYGGEILVAIAVALIAALVGH